VTGGAFQGRTVAILAGVTSVSFVAGLLLIAFGDEMGQEPSWRADTTSRSAVGHKAFVETLRAVGVPVLVSRHDSVRKAGESAVLVVAEPVLGQGEDAARREQSLRTMLDRPGLTLLVLPKWWAFAHPAHPAWIGSATRMPVEAVQQVLRVLDPSLTVRRDEPEASARWDADDVQIEPTIDEPQWIWGPSKVLTPVVSRGPHVLFGIVERGDGRRTYVLSDPDVLATHGLGKGDNAVFATRLVAEVARGTKRAVVFDETLHGLYAPPNPWRALFRFPLVLVLVSALLAAGVLLWAGLGRFGAPAPEPAPLGAGKTFLVDNTADLMHFGGHASGALERYFKATVQDVARATHAPPHLPTVELAEWLRRAGRARGVALDYDRLAEAVAGARESVPPDPRRVVAAASDIHRWRREMIDGTPGDP
jgi:hypothetical protein